MIIELLSIIEKNNISTYYEISKIMDKEVFEIKNLIFLLRDMNYIKFLNTETCISSNCRICSINSSCSIKTFVMPKIVLTEEGKNLLKYKN
ncbi:hypothetical protein OF820_04995 [Oceanotoga sp. DSM 15011]|jgi:hypothetical protein|uniref:Uncharacterized protein n=1 Tax=Oceanotoga teriensis TaxID=515440 RepID=A0AA45C7I6_9BACT|nr:MULTISPECIES: hypothetical protein [Oceanotoga]MDN5342166.1 hypothetical protein [Oceanotoga sp.]MDO7976207.1 hypothetical protein [Oceanotoga teriensis]PWJ95404.1 hypothetical protein C7380_10531 [Oceanotoga teriensis]UYP01043.1 hypothetical protein OF820_04995 [Oceanotoga sp. DSM 15011]